MTQNFFWAVSLLLIFTGLANAQSVPPPVPIVESDLRDNTIKMRSIELERVKRESNKSRPAESTEEREIRFALIKKDFEGIQKLQDSIIKAYTTGKKINYSKIEKSAINISKNSMRLDENLFGAKPNKNFESKKQKSTNRKSVRDLIIELDNEIGKFVKSPVFKSNRTVDSKISAEAQNQLENIIELSNILSIEAERTK